MKRYSLFIVCVLAAFASLATACGGGSASRSQPASNEGLEAAARGFFQAVKGADWSIAYGYLSAECHQQISKSEYLAQSITTAAMSKAFGTDLSKSELTTLEVRNVTDDAGEVLMNVTVDGEELGDGSTWQDWVYESGGWRTTKCEKKGESSSSSSKSSTEPEQQLTYQTNSMPRPMISGRAPDSTVWVVAVKNPNDTEQAKDIKLNVTLYNSAGTIVKTADERIGELPGGAQRAVGGIATDVVDVAKIDVVMTVGSWSKPAKPAGEYTLSGITSKSTSYSSELSGIVSSTFSSPTSVKVEVLYVDEAGKPVYNSYTYVSDIPANGQKSFTDSMFLKVPDSWKPTVTVWDMW